MLHVLSFFVSVMDELAIFVSVFVLCQDDVNCD